MSAAISEIEKLCKAARAKGYSTEGSIFKVDYNGETYTVGLWIRPARWNEKRNRYDLPGLMGKSKSSNFDVAVKDAIKKAKAMEKEEWNK